MKIEKELLNKMEGSFRNLKLHDGFKLIKTSLAKIRVEATYRYKDRDLCEELEMKFFIPRFHLGQEDPITDINTLDDICRSLSIHDLYEMYGLHIGRAKMSVEFFNIEDSTSIKVTTLR